MVETEMSIQRDIKSVSTSNYSKIETKENDCFIDPQDIKLGIYSKNIDEDDENNNIIKSNQLLPISIEEKKNYFYKKIGNTYAFFGDIYGDPEIIIGPHWPLYLCVVGIFSVGIYFFYIHLGKYVNTYLNFIGFIIYLIFLISYTYTALINPGYPKHDIDSLTGEPRKKFYFCDICKLWANKEKKTWHCYDCNICIEGYDHHCPWTGKCIGKKNFFSFAIFVGSVFILFIYFIIIVSTIDKKDLTKSTKREQN